MAVINPEHLLDQADTLLKVRRPGGLRQVDIRRAYSATYYAVFHALLNAASDAVVGSGGRGSVHWSLVSRSVSHRWLRELCEGINRPSPPKRIAPYIPPNGFGVDLGTIAEVVVDLQDKRLRADYDPLPVFLRSDAELSVATARTAVSRLASAPQVERSAFLTLVLFPPRLSGAP